MKTQAMPTPQDDVGRYREFSSICRQQAVLHPEASWKWLSQAEKWEHLAEGAAFGTAGSLAAVPMQKVA